MDNKFIENFKSEELEERLEFGKWRLRPSTIEAPIETEDGWVEGKFYGGKLTINFEE